MGQKNSSVSVTSDLSMHGDCGGVDTIELSYTRPGGCCGGRKKRLIASFYFPDMTNDLNGPRRCAQVAIVHMDKLARKDGDTPVMVRCLAGRVTLLTKRMTLADLLRGLNTTTKGHQAVLNFTLAGLGIQMQAGKPKQICAALFCNRRQVGEGGAEQATPELRFPYAMDFLQGEDSPPPQDDTTPVPEVDLGTLTSFPAPKADPQVSPVPEVDLGTLTSIPDPEADSQVSPVPEVDLGTLTSIPDPEADSQVSPVPEVDQGTLTSVSSLEDDLGIATLFEHKFDVCKNPSGDDQMKDTHVICPESVMEGVTSLPSLPQHDIHELDNTRTEAGSQDSRPFLSMLDRVILGVYAVALPFVIYLEYFSD